MVFFISKGNLGLKDQHLALTWIKENVSAFGGDPQNITLFGESAGSASVHYHMLSRKSQGLFHKAIMQSGTALCSWTQTKDPDAKVEMMAKTLNCSGKTSKEIKDRLRKVPCYDLVQAGTKLNQMPHLTTFNPVVERSGGEDAFLEQDPGRIMESAAVHGVPKIPMLIGYTANEMAPWAATLLNVKKLAPKMNDPKFIRDMFRSA